jgi:hypothetical protein
MVLAGILLKIFIDSTFCSPVQISLVVVEDSCFDDSRYNWFLQVLPWFVAVVVVSKSAALSPHYGLRRRA